MSGRGDEQDKEVISVMNSCYEKRIVDLEKNMSVMKSCYEQQKSCYEQQIQDLEEKDKRAKERIEDLEEVGALFLF